MNRVKQLRENLGLTQQELADKLNLSKSSISMYESNSRTPSTDILKKMSCCFNVSIDYILGASDDAKRTFLDDLGWRRSTTQKVGVELDKGAINIDDTRGKTNEELEEMVKQARKTTLPYYYTPVAAGNGQLVPDGTDFEYREYENPPKNADFAIGVRGNSMEPEYYDDETIFIKTNVVVEYGQIGIFIKNGEWFFKQWRDGVLASLNPKYPPIRIGEYDEFCVVGRVIGKAGE